MLKETYLDLIVVVQNTDKIGRLSCSKGDHLFDEAQKGVPPYFAESFRNIDLHYVERSLCHKGRSGGRLEEV